MDKFDIKNKQKKKFLRTKNSLKTIIEIATPNSDIQTPIIRTTTESDDPFNDTEYRKEYIRNKLKYRYEGPLFGNFEESDRRCSYGVRSITEAPAADPITIPDPVVPTATVFKSPTQMPRRDMSLRRKALSLKGNSSSPDLTFSTVTASTPKSVPITEIEQRKSTQRTNPLLVLTPVHIPPPKTPTADKGTSFSNPPSLVIPPAPTNVNIITNINHGEPPSNKTIVISSESEISLAKNKSVLQSVSPLNGGVEPQPKNLTLIIEKELTRDTREPTVDSDVFEKRLSTELQAAIGLCPVLGRNDEDKILMTEDDSLISNDNSKIQISANSLFKSFKKPENSEKTEISSQTQTKVKVMKRKRKRKNNSAVKNYTTIHESIRNTEPNPLGTSRRKLYSKGLSDAENSSYEKQNSKNKKFSSPDPREHKKLKIRDITNSSESNYFSLPENNPNAENLRRKTNTSVVYEDPLEMELTEIHASRSVIETAPSVTHNSLKNSRISRKDSRHQGYDSEISHETNSKRMNNEVRKESKTHRSRKEPKLSEREESIEIVRDERRYKESKQTHRSRKEKEISERMEIDRTPPRKDNSRSSKNKVQDSSSEEEIVGEEFDRNERKESKKSQRSRKEVGSEISTEDEIVKDKSVRSHKSRKEHEISDSQELEESSLKEKSYRSSKNKEKNPVPESSSEEEIVRDKVSKKSHRSRKEVVSEISTEDEIVKDKSVRSHKSRKEPEMSDRLELEESFRKEKSYRSSKNKEKNPVPESSSDEEIVKKRNKSRKETEIFNEINVSNQDPKNKGKHPVLESSSEEETARGDKRNKKSKKTHIMDVEVVSKEDERKESNKTHRSRKEAEISRQKHKNSRCSKIQNLKHNNQNLVSESSSEEEIVKEKKTHESRKEEFDKQERKESKKSYRSRKETKVRSPVLGNSSDDEIVRDKPSRTHKSRKEPEISDRMEIEESPRKEKSYGSSKNKENSPVPESSSEEEIVRNKKSKKSHRSRKDISHERKSNEMDVDAISNEDFLRNERQESKKTHRSRNEPEISNRMEIEKTPKEKNLASESSSEEEIVEKSRKVDLQESKNNQSSSDEELIRNEKRDKNLKEHRQIVVVAEINSRQHNSHSDISSDEESTRPIKENTNSKSKISHGKSNRTKSRRETDSSDDEAIKRDKTQPQQSSSDESHPETNNITDNNKKTPPEVSNKKSVSFEVQVQDKSQKKGRKQQNSRKKVMEPIPEEENETIRRSKRGRRPVTAYWCADHVELPYVSDRLAKQAFLHNLKIERQQKALRLKIKTESLKEEKKKAKKKVIHTKNADSDSGHISDDEFTLAVNVPKVPKPQFDWLSDMLNPNSYKKQPNVIEEVILSHGIAIKKSSKNQINFRTHDEIDYAVYSTENSSMGYMRFPPFAKKKMTKVKHFNMQFICLKGSVLFKYICGESHILNGGDLITLPIHSEYEMINEKNDILLMMFVKLIP